MYGKILVPVDGSTTSTRGLTEAVALARIVRAKLRLIHVVNELIIAPAYPAAMHIGQVIDSMRSYGKDVLQEAERLVRDNGLESESVLIESVGGPAGELIVDQASQWGAELIVLGTHGRRGLRRLVLGSDAEHVVRHAAIPVLLVRSA